MDEDEDVFADDGDGVAATRVMVVVLFLLGFGLREGWELDFSLDRGMQKESLPL